MMKSEQSCQEERLRGNQEPSERIVPDYVQSDGLDAAGILKAGGIVLDPWQIDTLCDWMGRTVSGRWAAPTCGGSVPRQNGKSLLAQGRAEAGMLLFNEQVVYTAHLQKTATETFEEMRDYFEEQALKKYVKEIKTAIGREQIILKSGARIKFLARTRNGGRGQHADLLIIDEAQEMDENAQASFLPAISASLNPQTIYIGTPPGPETNGTVFRNIRQRALDNRTSKTAWFEFSVDEIGDAKDKKRWAKTNPALGRQILLSTIESEAEQMDPDTFARERLGWWAPVVTNEAEKAIDGQAWKACMSKEQKPEGKTAYGIKFAADGSEVCLCGTVIPENGPARISEIKRKSTAKGLNWLAEWLNARHKQASCVVIDGRNGVEALVEKISDTWSLKDSVIRPTAKDMIASVSMLINDINEKAVTWYHLQGDLDDSAVTAAKRPIGGGYGFGGENSLPIEACALALWGCKTSKRNPKKKMRIG